MLRVIRICVLEEILLIENPVFFIVLATLVAEGDPYTIMDYVKVLGGIFLTGLTIYRIGDLKMILYVVAIACVVVGGIVLLPQLQGSPIRSTVLDFLGELPELIHQYLGGGSLI